MLYKTRSHSNNSKKYQKQQLPPIRKLNFPSKEDQDGYIGKKQFKEHRIDNVTLQSPESQKFIRINKLKTQDIDGAYPCLPIEPIINAKKAIKKRSNSEGYLKKMKTQGMADSLDFLINKNDKKQLYLISDGRQKKGKAKFQEKQISFEDTKQHILGIYDLEKYQRKYQISKKDIFLSPTYLSSLRPFCL